MRLKAIILLVVTVLLMSALCPLSFAVDQPETVNSPLYEPQPSYYVENGIAHLVFYQIFEDIGEGNYGSGNGPYLITYNCEYPETNTVYITSSSLFSGLASNINNCTVNTVLTRISDGILLRTTSNINPYRNFSGTNLYCYCGLQGYTPNKNNVPYYYIKPSEIPILASQNIVDPYINWAAIIPYFHSYTSYISEPIPDPYNRYIVIAGEEQQYIYLLSFALSDLTMFDSQSISQGGDEVDLTFSNVFTPCIKLDNNQLKLEIDIDPQIFYILNNTNTLYEYNLMLSKYKLLDGQYIESTLYNGSINSSVTSLSFDFGSVTDFDSIKTYGVQFIDSLNSNIHYNLLSCSWGHDPEFETWQENILFFLEGIYNLMNTSEDETVTISDDTSALNEMQSAENDLVVTDESGNVVDPVQAVGNNFSEAASQIGELSAPVSSINGLLQLLIFDKPKLVLPIIVALALGLLVTILGKNKSD